MAIQYFELNKYDNNGVKHTFRKYYDPETGELINFDDVPECNLQIVDAEQANLSCLTLCESIISGNTLNFKYENTFCFSCNDGSSLLSIPYIMYDPTDITIIQNTTGGITSLLGNDFYYTPSPAFYGTDYFIFESKNNRITIRIKVTCAGQTTNTVIL